MGIVNQQPITSITIAGQTMYGGDIEINAPGATIDPATGEITFPPGGGAGNVEEFTIIAADLVNKYLLVTADITIEENTKFEIETLAPQFHTNDFVIDAVNKKMVKWNGLGLDGLIELGDQVTITYF